MATNSHPICLSCCQTIIKAFERGAAYAVTEESTFALMTAPLSNMRASAKSFIQHEESTDVLNNPPTTKQKASFITANVSQSMNLRNLDKSDEDDEGFFKQIRGNFTEGQVDGTGGVVDADLFGGIFNSECIPCGERLNAIGQMNPKMDLENYGKQWLEMWKQALQNFLQQLQDILDVFNNMDKYVDLCALLRFLKDFVCIPDLQRILAALMALMSKVSFELGGIFDLILGLIGPILSPFLSGLVDMLMRDLMLIIRPIECILDALQNIISKLDYNILFDNIETLDRNHKPAQRKKDPRGPIKIPFFSASIQRRDIVSGGGVLDKVQVYGDIGFNKVTDVFADPIKERKAREQADVDRAADELRALDEAAKAVDGSDQEAVKRYQAQRKFQVKKYNDAVQTRDTKNIAEELFGARSKVGAAQDAVASFKGVLFQLMAQLREAMEFVEGFVADLVDEFRKIMGEYVGGQSGIVAQIIKKFALVQMISLIHAIISAFQRGDLGCDDEKDDIRPESIFPPNKDIKIWTSATGEINIEEDPDELDRALRAAVGLIGIEEKEVDDEGESVDTPGQKLKNLIEFTGDPLLDTEIARTTEALITPRKVTFKCPLQTSVSDAEQVNEWIRSLNL